MDRARWHNVSSVAWAGLVFSTIALFLALYLAVVWFDEPPCNDCNAFPDSLLNAAQIGRLDIVSLILGLLAIAVIFGSLLGYQVVKNAAMDAAREEANDLVQRQLPKLLDQKFDDLMAQFIENNPAILRSAVLDAKDDVEDISESDFDLLDDSARGAYLADTIADIATEDPEDG